MVADKVVKKVRCGFCSGGACGLLVTVENGRATNVELDPKDPVFPRHCTKYQASLEYIYHPDRLNYPLRRSGKRGEGKWDIVSWEEAFDEIGGKLNKIIDKYGPEAIASAAGTLRATHIYQPMSRFMNLIQSPNQGSEISLTCYGTGSRAGRVSVGQVNLPFLAVGKTSLIFAPSGNADESMPHAYPAIMSCVEGGAKLIVVEVRATDLTERADLLLRIRPGTDCALYLGMLCVIITEKLYDKKFVDEWCYGFEQLRERVMEYPPDKVAQITGAPEDKIVEAARMYAQYKPAVFLYSHTQEATGRSSFQTFRAAYALRAITGSIDSPGGDYICEAPKFRTDYEICGPDLLDKEQRKKQMGYEEFPVGGWKYFEHVSDACMKRGTWKGTWGNGTQCGEITGNWYMIEEATKTGKPYPIKSWIVGDSGPMQCWADTKRVYEAIQNLELFVMVDMFHTPSTMLADYVLPCTSQFERSYLYDFNGCSEWCMCQERVLPRTIPGEYDRRDDYDIFRELARRVIGEEKLKQHWPWETLEDLWDYRLEPAGTTLMQLINEKGGIYMNPPRFKKYAEIDAETNQPKGFGTPTGKIELYSTILEKLGLDPLPHYIEPAESPVSTPELAKEYPYILTSGGRRHELHHSELRQIRSRRMLHRYPRVQIHPVTARSLGIGDEDWVWIETPRGRCMQKCEYYPGIDPQVVHAEHGWWYPEEPGEEPHLFGVWRSNINICWDNSPDKCSREVGAMPFKAGLCRIYKVQDHPTTDSILKK